MPKNAQGKVKVTQLCPTLSDPMDYTVQENTGVGSCSLLQEIVPTQRSNPGLSHCRRILYQLSHKQGSPPKIKTYNYLQNHLSIYVMSCYLLKKGEGDVKRKPGSRV